MKCKKCNTENNKDNNFCVKCGEKLIIDKSVNEKFCSSCGSKNISEASFCSNCGESFSTLNSKTSDKKSNKKNINTKRSKNQPKVLDIAGLIKEHKLIAGIVSIFLMFILYRSLPQTSDYNSNNFSSIIPSNSFTREMPDSVTVSVMSKFICSCGDCTDPLEQCTCETAAEERDFIRTRITQNFSTEETVLAVINKYGGLKDDMLNVGNANSDGWNIPSSNN